MPLGKSVEITISVNDLPTAIAFYEKLDFKKIADDALTDGSYNLRLKTDGSPSPTLTYYGVDFDDVRAAGIPVTTTTNAATMTTLDGLRLSVCTDASNIPMPEGTPTSRKPLSKCGKFGEFAMKVESYKKSAKFWGRLGYAELHQADIPYVYGILSDGLFVLGLHEGMDTFGPFITYFSGDMPNRIDAIKKLGIAVTPLSPPEDGKITNASFTGIGGEKYFLFTGEI